MEFSEVEQVPSEDEKQQKGGGMFRLFQHSAIYSLSTSVQRLQGLIMTPIYTSTIYLSDTSQYSNYGLIYTFIAFMNFVYLLGMDAAFLRYFFLGKADRKTVLSSTLGVLFISGISASIILFLFAGQIAELFLFNRDLSRLVELAAIILFLDSIGNIPFLILRAEERAVAFTVFRMIRFTMELLLNLLFVVYLKMGVLGILYANILAAFLNLLMMFPFTLKYVSWSFDRPLLSEMLRFGLPFLPNGVAFMVIEMIDRFLVTNFLGKEVLAFYHANYKFATVLLLFIVGFRNAWQPFFLRTSKQPEAPVVFSRIFSYYLFIAGAVVVLMTLFVRPVLTFHYLDKFYLLGQNYWQGIEFIPWIILAYFFFGIYIIFTPAFFIHKKSQLMVLFTGAGAIINVLVNLWLLPLIGIWGAVVATVLAYLVMAVSIFVIAQRIYPVPVEKKRVFLLILMVALIYLICHIIDLSIYLRIMLLVLYGTVVWGMLLSRTEKIQLRNVLRRIRK